MAKTIHVHVHKTQDIASLSLMDRNASSIVMLATRIKNLVAEERRTTASQLFSEIEKLAKAAQ